MENELVQKRASPYEHPSLSQDSPVFGGSRALCTLHFGEVLLGGSVCVLYLLERTDFLVCLAQRPSGSDCIALAIGIKTA